ncbi:hypothetical protein E4U41_001274 [Claviceps citrina]|nr:hypothetical protein E4U41_001274 [Claviceps citrina]
MLYTRIQGIIRHRARRHRREVEISAPFGLRRETVNLPGLSQEEISILREKAAASQIGVLELRPESPSEYTFHKMSRPSPRLRRGWASSSPPSSSSSSYNGDESRPRPRELEARPLWY